MKSLNTKKIVAMATGAALLGSALLGAVSYQNTELINDNGAPMAKVVVGSNAHISDGVAAANIAAVLGNMAFKSVEVTATPTGINGLSCDVSGDSAGTCSVLSKSVDLEVVTPAGVIPAGAYGFETLIGGYVDSDLKDRTPQTDESHKIKTSDFSELVDYAVKDPQSSFTSVESQTLYVYSEAVMSFDSDDGFQADGIEFEYVIEFDDSIPVCTNDVDSDSCTFAAGDAGATSANYRLDSHRVKIKFLGQEWIISDMEVDTVAETFDSITLAKESAYSPKLQIGEDLDLGDGNKLVLGDLKPASGQQLGDSAIFSVLNAAGEEIASQAIEKGDTIDVQAGANTYKIKVYQVAPGYTLTEKWAEVAVYANELELKDGEDLDDENEDWTVALTSKDFQLSKITLTSNSFDEKDVGESMTIVEDPAIWRLTFTGLDLKEGDTSDYNKVVVSSESIGTGINVYDCETAASYSSKSACNEFVNAIGTMNMIKLSANAKIFSFDDVVKGQIEETDTIYIATANTTTAGGVTNITVGDIFYKPDSFMVPIKTFQDFNGTPFDANVVYDDGERNKNVSIVTDYVHGTVLVTFEEDADDSLVDYIGFQTELDVDKKWMIADEGERIYLNSSAATDPAAVADYAAGAYDSALLKVIGDQNVYYSPRGSYAANVKRAALNLYLAKEVGHLSFILQATGAAESEAGAMTYSNLKEGDSIDVLGAKVKVKAIDVETGPCTSATGAGSVTGIEGIACTINANVANLGERQNIPTDLVIMDKAATNVETVIAVGGPMVNDVTAALFPAENPLQGAGDVYIAEVAAGKIVVAGYTADDTMDAAMNFIATLRGQ